MDHVTLTNANDEINLAHVVDQVVISRDELMKLSDSIHAPKGQSVVNLPPNDLRYQLNVFRHKLTLD